MSAPMLRLDKWLWFSRLFKSRTLAAKLCESGRVRVNGNSIGKSNHSISQGDILTFPKGPHIRVIKVLELGVRRGPAPEAEALYEDLEPPVARKERLEIEKSDVRTAPIAERERGSGRPTKTERRAMEKLRGDIDKQEDRE